MKMSAKASGRGVLWAAMGQGGGQILSLLIFLVIARHVSPASFGLVAVSLAAIEFLRRVLIDPITYVVTAKPGVRAHDFDICFSLLLVVSTVTALIVFVFAPYIADALGVSEASQTLRVLSLILIALGLSGTPGAWLVRKMEFRALALRSTVSVIVGGVVGIVMSLRGFELWSLVGQQLTIQVVNVITLWVSAGWRPKIVLHRHDITDTLRKARPISASAVWTSIANDADLFFAAAYLGPAVAGFYNAAKRIMLAANMMLVNTIGTVALPSFANLETREQRKDAFLAALRFTAVVTAPAFAGLSVVAPEFVTFILGPNWAMAAPILTALAISGFATSLSQLATYLLLVEQRSHLDSRSSAIFAIANVLAFLVAAPLGAMPLAIASTVTAFLILPIRFGFALRDQDIAWSDVLRAVAPAVSVTIGMVACVVVVRQLMPVHAPAWFMSFVLIGVGVIAYGVLLRVVAPTLFRTLVAAAREIFSRAEKSV